MQLVGRAGRAADADGIGCLPGVALVAGRGIEFILKDEVGDGVPAGSAARKQAAVEGDQFCRFAFDGEVF